MFIGHSRYGYFTTALLASRPNDVHAVISLSPFFHQENVDLTDSIAKVIQQPFSFKRYYRYGIGNDYPEDFGEMEAVLKQQSHTMFDAHGWLFEEADHNVTPGLTIGVALYEIFEKWSEIQADYIFNNEADLNILPQLESQIEAAYGNSLSFALGILNGKGWYFYGEEQYVKAIEAWEILLHYYPNFSETYLYIIDAQMQLKLDTSATKELFKQSIATTKFYTSEELEELHAEFMKLEE
jgi:tetratricopeptide (TPR) repeat protein